MLTQTLLDVLIAASFGFIGLLVYTYVHATVWCIYHGFRLLVDKLRSTKSVVDRKDPLHHPQGPHA